jgi:flagellin
MALGVLNNLSAIYAENNLNNTSNSLQKVLQELSSGSKINSGADDAAGLSLVSGLEANSQALSQSVTNSTEGVGLLDVADGALSQVTSLLDRAVTLATEASNGTLNSTQEQAANQEYDSILAEINNIGSTTTYNQQTVFNGSTVAIYTGDSSSAGSSVDNLKIRTLSESSVGDTSGQMSYSSGQDNVFLDLSNDGHNASLTDSLNSSGATTITVGYLTKGSSGSLTQATANITVGSGTSYANTVQGLITAINDSGLGLTASFTTASQAGTAAATAASEANNGGGSATDTGIQISDQGIGTGTSGTGVIGTLAMSKSDTLGGTLTVVGSDGSNHNITLGTANKTDTLANLMSTINSAGYGVTATLNTAGTILTFTTADSKVTVSASNLTENTASTSSNTTIQDSGLGTLTVGSSSDTLSGTLNTTEGADGANTASTIVLGKSGTSTLSQLAQTINTDTSLGITATLNTTTVNGHAAGTMLTFTKSSGDLGTPALSTTSLEDIASPSVAQGGTLGSLTVAASGDSLGSGTLTIKSGITGASSTLNLGTSGTTDTLANLAQTINNGNYGITATLNATDTALTFTQSSGNYSASITGNGTDVTYTTAATPLSVSAGSSIASLTVANASDTLSVSTAGDGLVLSGNASGTIGSLTVVNNTSAADAAAATLSGTLNVTDSAGTVHHINLATGNGGGAFTLASLQNYFATDATADTWGITANYSASATGTLDTSNIVFTGTGSAAIDTSAGLTGAGAGTDTVSASSVATTTIDLSGGQTLAQVKATINSLTALYGVNASINTAAEGTYAAGTILSLTETAGSTSGSLAVTSGQTLKDTTQLSSPTTSLVAGSGATLGSITIGNSGWGLETGTLNITTGSGASTTLNLGTAGSTDTLSDLATTINNSNDGIKATVSSDGKTITFAEKAGDTHTPAITSGTITEGTVVDQAADLGYLTANNASDTLSGTFTIQEGVDGKNTTTSLDVSSKTLAQIEAMINSGGYGITATLNTAANGVAAGTVLTFTANSTNQGTASITNNGVISDTSSQVNNDEISVTNPSGATLGTLTVANSSDVLTGTLDMVEGVDTAGTTSTYSFSGQTLQQIYETFENPPDDANSYDGIKATLSGDGKTLTFTASAGDAATPSISGTGITDITPAATTNQTVNSGTILNTITVDKNTDTVSGTLNLRLDSGNTTDVLAGMTLQQIADQFDSASGTYYNEGVTATISGDTLTFSQSIGATTTVNVTSAGVLSDVIQPVTSTVTIGSSTMLNTLTVANGGTDTLSGSLTIHEGVDGSNTASTYNLAGKTLTAIASDFDSSTGSEYGLGIYASVSGNTLTFSAIPGNVSNATVTGSNIIDQTGSSSSSITTADGTMLDTLSVNNATDLLGGSLVITSGITGAASTIVLGNTTGTKTDTLTDLAAAINSGGYGITATLNAAGTKLTFTQSSGGFTAAVSGSSVTDSEATNTTASSSLGFLSVATSSDKLSGTLTGVEGDGKTAYTIDLGISGETDTLADLENYLNVTRTAYGITATMNQAGTDLVFSATSGDTGTPTLSNEGIITDTTPSQATTITLGNTPTVGEASITTLGSLSILSTDTLSGSLTIGSNTISIGSTDDTAATLASTINNGNYGVTATYSSTSGLLTFTSENSSLAINSSALDETPLNSTTATAVGNLSGTASTASAYYSVSITGTVQDSSTTASVGGVTTYGGTSNVGITTDTNGSGSVATISYSDSAGQSLAGTDLLSTSDAQTALNDLNVAISDVAAMDGYIGAQINTLNSISSVLNTQMENVTSAQNALQATDYASATSAMSKYEVLSQTGIAALAQANTVQQEVTKLLQ